MKAPWRVGAFLLATTIVAASCGGDDGNDAGAPKEKEVVELTAVTPFPSEISFYPIYVAQERGYFADEGLSVTTEPLDGSGAALQQLLAGQADLVIASTGPFMQAVAKGADIVSIYVGKRKNVFSVQVPVDSKIQTLEDLKGQTIGVAERSSGEVPYLKALLTGVAGLEEGKDYKLPNIGFGPAGIITALNKDQITAAARSYPDFVALRMQGVEMRNLVPPDLPELFDDAVIVNRDLVDASPEVVEGIGRALAKATAWSMQNPPEATVELTSKYFPEENENPEFAVALMEEVQQINELPPEANGQWGVALSNEIQTYMEFLIAAGELDQPVDQTVFVNDFVDAYKDFDPNDL